MGKLHFCWALGGLAQSHRGSDISSATEWSCKLDCSFFLLGKGLCYFLLLPSSTIFIWSGTDFIRLNLVFKSLISWHATKPRGGCQHLSMFSKHSGFSSGEVAWIGPLFLEWSFRGDFSFSILCICSPHRHVGTRGLEGGEAVLCVLWVVVSKQTVICCDSQNSQEIL